MSIPLEGVQFHCALHRRQRKYLANSLSRISFPIYAGGGDAGDNGNDSNCDSDHELNTAFPACDIAVPTVNELPSLASKEINLEECRDDNAAVIWEKLACPLNAQAE